MFHLIPSNLLLKKLRKVRKIRITMHVSTLMDNFDWISSKNSPFLWWSRQKEDVDSSASNARNQSPVLLGRGRYTHTDIQTHTELGFLNATIYTYVCTVSRTWLAVFEKLVCDSRWIRYERTVRDSQLERRTDNRSRRNSQFYKFLRSYDRGFLIRTLFAWIRTIRMNRF